MSQQPYKTIFVLGIARSGSTLFGRMLDAHSEILCVGEMMWADLTLKDCRTCSCGAALDRCPFWSERLPLLIRESQLKYRRFTPELYSRLAELSSKKIVLDLSKTRVWRALCWPPNRRWVGRADYGFVFLLRDSRGVTASSIRGGKDFKQSIKTHFKWMKRFGRFIEKASDRVLLIRYEDLCSKPKQELTRFCTFAGVDFEVSCLDPMKTEHHLVRCSKSDYMKNQRRIQVDERWKLELSSEQISNVEKEMTKVPFLRKAYLNQS